MQIGSPSETPKQRQIRLRNRVQSLHFLHCSTHVTSDRLVYVAQTIICTLLSNWIYADNTSYSRRQGT